MPFHKHRDVSVRAGIRAHIVGSVSKFFYTSCNQILGSAFYRLCGVIMENWVV